MSEAHDGTAQPVAENAAPVDQVAEDQATATAEDGDTGDDAAAAGDQTEGDGQQPKPRKSPQERIDEVTRARREAERDRDYWREQALANQQPAKPARETAEDAEPDPSDYEHGELDARFIRDHATYHAKRTFREENAQAEAQRQRQGQLATFEAKADAFSEKTPDYYDVVGSDFGKVARLCTPVMGDAILASEAGPELAYHLAKSPSEARRIAALNPLAQAMELGKLAQRLASPPAPTPKTATDAPAPTPQVRGAGGRFTVAADTDDFAAFEKQYGV